MANPTFSDRSTSSATPSSGTESLREMPNRFRSEYPEVSNWIQENSRMLGVIGVAAVVGVVGYMIYNRSRMEMSGMESGTESDLRQY